MQKRDSLKYVSENTIDFCMNSDYSFDNYNFISCLSEKTEKNFSSNISIKKNNFGEIEAVHYFDYNGDLTKIFNYKDQNIKSIEYYSFGKLSYVEFLENTKVIEKRKYDKNSQICEILKYKYTKDGLLTNIEKHVQNKILSVKYAYDVLKRIQERIFSFNYITTFTQNYKYDILDRIIEYQDNDKKILIKKVNKNNQIVNYEMYNKTNSKIIVNNYFDNYKYLQTELIENGKQKFIKNNNYVDNPLLKRPFAKEEDLDFMLYEFFDRTKTSRTSYSIENNTNSIINNKINSNVLPISMRKWQLYNTKVINS